LGFCPVCKYEYQVDLMVCPDCNKELVEQLPAGNAAAVNPDHSWVIVGGVMNPMNFDIAKGSLDSNNIPSMILSSSFDTTGLTAMLRSKKSVSVKGSNVIMVPREFEEEAALLLEMILGDDLIQSSTQQE